MITWNKNDFLVDTVAVFVALLMLGFAWVIAYATPMNFNTACFFMLFFYHVKRHARSLVPEGEAP